MEQFVKSLKDQLLDNIEELLFGVVMILSYVGKCYFYQIHIRGEMSEIQAHMTKH